MRPAFYLFSKEVSATIKNSKIDIVRFTTSNTNNREVHKALNFKFNLTEEKFACIILVCSIVQRNYGSILSKHFDIT